MYYTNFKISDFCIAQKHPLLPEIADRILLHWVLPLNKVQDYTPFDVCVSYSKAGEPSGYRPYFWEKARGRSGGSQHTFGERAQILSNEKGACDITCDEFNKNKDALVNALIEHTDILRIAVYDTFIHADYKNTHAGKRMLFTSNRASQWKFIKFIENN